MNWLLILPPLTISLLSIGSLMALQLMRRANIRRRVRLLVVVLLLLLIAHQLLIFSNLTYADSEVAVSAALSGMITFLIAALVAVVALPLSRIAERDQRRRKEMATMLRLSQALVSATNAAEVFQQSAETAKDLLAVDCSSIVLFDPQRNQFIVQAGYGWPGPIGHAPEPVQGDNSQANYTISQQRPVVVRDYRREKAFTVNPQLLERGIVAGVSAPMWLDGQAVGVIMVYSRKARNFGDDDVRRLSLIANQAGIALDKIRLLAEARWRADALARLNDITRAAIERQEFNALIQTLADRLGELIDADGCYITLWDEQHQHSIPGTATGPLGKEFRSAHIDPAQPTLTEYILQTQCTLLMEDVHNDPRANLQLAEQFNVRSLLGLPLIANEVKLGAALITFSQLHHFTPEEIAISEQAAAQIALVIGRARLFDEAQRHARELAGLYDTMLATSSVLDTEMLLERFYEQVQQLLAPDSFVAALYESDSKELDFVLVMENGKRTPRFRLPVNEGGFTGWVISNRHDLLLHDLQIDPTPIKIEAATTPARAWLGVPLIARERVIGAVSVQSYRPSAFSEADQRFLKAAAGQVAVALENARLFETTRRNSQEFKAAGDILHSLNATGDIVEAFPAIVAGLKAISHCERISLALLDESHQCATFVALDQPRAELGQGVRMPIANTAAAADVLAGRIHLTADLSRELDFPAERLLYDAGHRSRMNLPLRIHDQIIGALNLTWREVAGYDTAQLPLLSQIADAMALAAEKSRLFNEARRRDAILGALAYASEKLLTPGNLDDVLADVVANLGATANVSRAYIFENQTAADGTLLAHLNSEWFAAGQTSPAENFNAISQLYTTASFERWINTLHTGSALHGLVRDFPETEKGILEAYGIRSIVVVPIFIGPEWWGFLGFSDCEYERIWSGAEIEALKSVAGALGAALARQRSEIAEREHQALTEALRSTATAISSTLDFDEVLDRILAAVGRVVPHDAANIMLIDGELAHIVRCHGYDVRGLEQQMMALRVPFRAIPNLRYIAETGKPLAIPDSWAFKNWIKFEVTRWVRSLASAPICIKGQTIGFLNLDSETPDFFTQKHAERLGAFADQAGLAIENARLFSAEQRGRASAAALLEIAQVATSSLQFNSVLKQIAQRSAQACQANRCTIFLLDEPGDMLRPVMSQYADGHSDDEQWQKLQSFTVDSINSIPLFRDAVRERRPILLEDPEQTQLVPAHWTQPFGVEKLLIIPLFSHDRTIGMIVLDHTDPNRHFTDDQINLALTIAGQVTGAIANAKLYAEVERRAEELATLARVGEALTRAQTAEETLQLVLEEAIELVTPAEGAILLVEPATDRLQMVAVYSGAPEAMQKFNARHWRVDEGTFRYSIGQGEMLEIADTATDPRILRIDTEILPKQLTEVPLKSAHGVLGVIALNGLPRDERARHLLHALADLAAAAIEKTRLLDETRRRATQLEVLRRAAEQLAAHLDQETLFSQVLTILDRDFHCTGAIFLVDENTSEVVWAAGNMSPDPQLSSQHNRMKIGEGLVGTVAAGGVPQLINDTQSEHKHLDDPLCAAPSALAVPLKSGGQVIGVLYTCRDIPHAYQQEDVNLLQTLADQISIALTNARLYTEVRQLAITDGLTGLPNHRHFFELAKREFERARRYERPLAAIMLDIDHFKQLNDTYGHQVGNEVLRTLAERFRSSLKSVDRAPDSGSAGLLNGEATLRDFDIIGRYGGEEFAVVLPESDLVSACRAAERLRLSMAERPVQTRRGPLKVTISLGVAEMDKNCPDFLTLLDRADAAMYAARTRGRRNVVGSYAANGAPTVHVG